MSQKDRYPTALEMFTYAGQKKDHLLRLFDSTSFPWEENGSERTMLGHSLAAHYQRMMDVARDLTLPKGFGNLFYGRIFGHDDLCLVTSNLEARKKIEKVLELMLLDRRKRKILIYDYKTRYNQIKINGFPAWALVQNVRNKEDGLVSILCLFDQIMIAEREEFEIQEEYRDLMSEKWGIDFRLIQKDDYREKINGNIRSLPQKFDLEAIKKTELAKLWRIKVNSWRNMELREVVSTGLENSYKQMEKQNP